MFTGMLDVLQGDPFHRKKDVDGAAALLRRYPKK